MRPLLIAVLSCLTICVARGEEITVSAAISLKEAVTDAARQYEAMTGDHITFNFGASGMLAMQIKQGAPVDAFISAANQQVDDLSIAKMIDRNTRRVIVRNAIVLIVPASANDAPGSFESLADEKVRKIAIGEPKAVPAGTYAMQTLSSLHLTDRLHDRLIFGANVRQVLDYVQRNEVDAGIVYATDAKQAGDSVKVVATADSSTHQAIEYPAVVVSASAHAAAAAKFLDYLATPEAQSILAAKGFELPTAAAPITTQPAP